MKRTAIKRKTPLRQRRAQGPDIEREPRPRAALPTLRPITPGTYAGSTSGQPVAKEQPLQHSGYMDAVRALGYCMLCGRACRPQFCHSDSQGKGMGLKTDCRLGWPGCGPGEWGPGCHYIVGTSGHYAKDERRVLEKRLGRKTRAAVLAAGTWPARLPAWSDA